MQELFSAENDCATPLRFWKTPENHSLHEDGQRTSNVSQEPGDHEAGRLRRIDVQAKPKHWSRLSRFGPRRSC